MSILTSVPFWALAIAHCGQNWGFWMLLTELPTYMASILKFNFKEVRKNIPRLTMNSSFFSLLATVPKKLINF